jgi:hypothetical protein
MDAFAGALVNEDPTVFWEEFQRWMARDGMRTDFGITDDIVPKTRNVLSPVCVQAIVKIAQVLVKQSGLVLPHPKYFMLGFGQTDHLHRWVVTPSEHVVTKDVFFQFHAKNADLGIPLNRLDDMSLESLKELCVKQKCEPSEPQGVHTKENYTAFLRDVHAKRAAFVLDAKYSLAANKEIENLFLPIVAVLLHRFGYTDIHLVEVNFPCATFVEQCTVEGVDENGEQQFRSNGGGKALTMMPKQLGLQVGHMLVEPTQGNLLQMAAEMNASRVDPAFHLFAMQRCAELRGLGHLFRPLQQQIVAEFVATMKAMATEPAPAASPVGPGDDSSDDDDLPDLVVAS